MVLIEHNGGTREWVATTTDTLWRYYVERRVTNGGDVMWYAVELHDVPGGLTHYGPARSRKAAIECIGRMKRGREALTQMEAASNATRI